MIDRGVPPEYPYIVSERSRRESANDSFWSWFCSLWRSPRLGMIAISWGVLIYSFWVMIVVATMGDIGVECVFGTALQRSVDGSDYEWAPRPPAKGDRLLQIGDRKIQYYTDYVDALRDLGRNVDRKIVVRWRSIDGSVHSAVARIRYRPFRSYVWSLVWFFQEMVIFAIGARVYWKRNEDDSARLFFRLCVVTVGAFMGGYHWSWIVVSLPLIYLFAAFAMFVPIVSFHFYLVFPRVHRVLLTRRRLILGLLYGIPGVYLATIWGGITWIHFAKSHPELGVEGAIRVVRYLSEGYIVVASLVFAGCLALLFRGFFHARTISERNQIKWILVASVFSSILIGYVLFQAYRDAASLARESAAWKMFVVSLFYTLAYAVSITRYKLMHVDEIINRSVIYFSVSLALGMIYWLAVVGSAAAVGANMSLYHTSFGAKVVAAAAFALLILAGLARERFQRALDRRFHREKYKFDQAMRKMSQAVGSLIDRERLGQRLLEAASEILRLDWGAIYLVEPGGGEMTLAACLGPEPDQRKLAFDDPLVARLRGDRSPKVLHASVYSSGRDAATDSMISLGGEIAYPLLAADGSPAGVLILGPKRNGMPYEEEEIAFLGALGSVTTLALHSAGIQETLKMLEREVREKVEKIAEQQRRILILQNQVMDRPGGVEVSSHNQLKLPTDSDPTPFEGLIGKSASMKRMIETARKVALSQSAVLIRGESGTGKERLAEAIHFASPRRDGPFVKVHCAALSQTLLESELFGHVKGAFTGADRDRIGRFQQADGGTLFLDEIGDINLEVQIKLLRVLQETTFEKVGSSQPIRVDVRIVAATHQDLESLIRAGRFRSDLYYRLNVISISTPSLRDRREDVFELAIHFLRRAAARIDKPIQRIDDDAIECLIHYSWPGNIRELENVIERAVVLADGPSLGRDDLPEELRSPRIRRSRAAAVASNSSSVASLEAITASASASGSTVSSPSGLKSAWDDERMFQDLDSEVEAYERERLIEALDSARGNKSEAARLLAMPRSTFFSKLKKHGLA
jgi:DNA-binding NtrC family response regulator